MKQVFRSSEVSKFFHVSLMAVDRWIRNGYLPAYETAGGHYRVMRKDLVAFCRKKGRPLPDELITKEEKYRVLVVDDNASIVEAVRRVVQEIDTNIEVALAYNAFDAGVQLGTFKPHLVVLDVRMPGANGDVICKKIKQSEEFKNTKIIVFTGYPEDGKKLLELGADCLFEKGGGFDIYDLRKKVVEMLGIKYQRVIPRYHKVPHKIRQEIMKEAGNEVT